MKVYGGGEISSREVRQSQKLEILEVIWKWEVEIKKNGKLNSTLANHFDLKNI